ncbi:MAG: hypothetical protein IK099_06200 [Clostridia bacterium]|nr:hypothetical protein [Clostridia bacterium]
MNRKWNRTACAIIALVLLCSCALPVLAETDATLNAFTKYAKMLRGKGASFKYDAPEVFEGKSVIAVYYDLGGAPLELSTEILQQDGDYWMIPEELLAKNIKEADWALLVYGLDEEYYDNDWPITVYCFAVDVKNGVQYAPFEIYSRDTLIGNDERTYELNGTLAGMDEFIIYQAWQKQHGGETAQRQESEWEPEKEPEKETKGESEKENEIDEYYQQAMDFLREEKYYSAREAFLSSYTDGAYEQAQKCLKAWPGNGEVWRTSSGKGDKCEFTVVVNQDSDRAMLLRFYRRGYPISFVFIGGTGQVKITLPEGLYTVKSGEGYDWYGYKEAFGRYGSYETMTFDGKEEIKLEAGHAYTLTINTDQVNPDADDVGSEYESWEGFCE